MEIVRERINENVKYVVARNEREEETCDTHCDSISLRQAKVGRN